MVLKWGIIRLQILEGKSEEKLHFLIEVADSGKVKEQFAPWAEFKDEVQLGGGLEGIGQLNDKRVLHVFL